MIGSNIPLTVLPQLGIPQTVLQTQHHQNRHQHSYPKLHRWDDTDDGVGDGNNPHPLLELWVAFKHWHQHHIPPQQHNRLATSY